MRRYRGNPSIASSMLLVVLAAVENAFQRPIGSLRPSRCRRILDESIDSRSVRLLGGDESPSIGHPWPFSTAARQDRSFVYEGNGVGERVHPDQSDCTEVQTMTVRDECLSAVKRTSWSAIEESPLGVAFNDSQSGNERNEAERRRGGSGSASGTMRRERAVSFPAWVPPAVG